MDALCIAIFGRVGMKEGKKEIKRKKEEEIAKGNLQMINSAEDDCPRFEMN